MNSTVTTSSFEERLNKLGKKLPEPPTPKGNYVTAQWADESTLFLSGHLPTNSRGEIIRGKVGRDLTAEEATAAAESACLNLLATLQREIGDLDRVQQFVKVTGFVNCVDDFDRHAGVIDGCSNLLVKLFPEGKGLTVRAAIGANSLPLNAAVVIEMIVKILPAESSTRGGNTQV